MPEKTISDLHGGHRDRLRHRVRENGAQSLADHELLELLLFYVIPRRDTNELAHRLIEECGSLSGVLEAPIEQLCRICGIKEQAALYLRALGDLARRYAVSKFETGADPMKTVYDTADKLAAVIYPHFLGQVSERMLVLLFDGAMHMVDLFVVAVGSQNSVNINVRMITERAYSRRAAFAVLAHNHPGGVATPSPEDIRLTQDVERALRLLGIPLIEHFIFTDHAYFPIIANSGLLPAEDPEYPEAAQFRRLICGSRGI